MTIKNGSWHIYNTPDVQIRRNLDYLQMLGYTDGDAEYRIERQQFQSLLIGRIKNGSGVLRTKGNEYFLVEGQFFFLDCRSPHLYHTSQDCWQFEWLHVFGSHAQDFLDWHEEDLPLLYRGNKCAWLNEAMDQVFSLVRSQEAGRQRDLSLNGHILTMLGVLGSICYRTLPVHPVVLKAQRWMQENYQEPFSLEKLALEVSLSKYHLIKQFNKFVGETPGKYYSKIRIDKSKLLLENTCLSVEQIAEEVGFSDASSYIRCFRERENITPARFRSEVFGTPEEKNESLRPITVAYSTTEKEI